MNNTTDPFGAPAPQPQQGTGAPQGQYSASNGAYQAAGPQYQQAQNGPQSGYGPQPSYGAPAGDQPYSAYGNQQQYPPQGQSYPPQYGQPTQPQFVPAPMPTAYYSPRSKMTAGLLGIFLGGLGVHNFYLGFYTKAVIQLLLSLIGWIFFGLGPVAAYIWGLVEGVLIIGSDSTSSWHVDANGVQLRD
jgi:TM2 domain-containing membrane protein YozV